MKTDNFCKENRPEAKKKLRLPDQSIFIAVRQIFVYNKNVMDFCASPNTGLAQDRCASSG